MKLVKIPIIKPNAPDGGFIVNCAGTGGEKIGYPEGTQCYAWFYAPAVTGVVPDADGGCRIFLASSPIAHYCALPADAVVERLFGKEEKA